MNKSEILIDLETIFRQVLKRQDLILSEDLKGSDVAEWDSLSHLNLIGEIESHFKIKFKLKELITMQSVGDMVRIIELKYNF